MTQTLPDTAGQVQALTDRTEIMETFYRLFLCVDTRNWDGLHGVWTDEVHSDYTALWGGEPQTQPRQALIDGWRASLSGFQTTQHFIGNHLVELRGDEATVTVYFHAQHFLPNDRGDNFWTLGGGYVAGMTRTPQGWRVSSLQLLFGWADGNMQLFELARQRTQP